MNSFSNSDQNDFDQLAASNARISNGINNIHGDLTETNNLIKSGFNSQTGILSAVKNGISSVGRGISNVYNNNKEQYGVDTQEFSKRVAAMAGGPIGVAVRDILSNSGINVGNIVKKSIGGVANMFHGHNDKLDDDINGLKSIGNRQLASDDQQLMEAKKSNQLLNDIKNINAKQLDSGINTTALNNKATRLNSNSSKSFGSNEIVGRTHSKLNSTQLNNAVLKSAHNAVTGASSSPSEVVNLLRQIAESQEGMKNFFQDPSATKEGGIFGTLAKEIISMPFGFKYWFGGRYSKDIQRSNNPLETIVNALLKTYEWQRIGLDLTKRQLNELIRLQGGQTQTYVGHEGAAFTAIKKVGNTIKEGATKMLGNNAFGRAVGSTLALPISLLRFGDEDFKNQQFIKAHRVFTEVGKSRKKGWGGFWQNISGSADEDLNRTLYSERNQRRYWDYALGSDVDNRDRSKLNDDFVKTINSEDEDKIRRLRNNASLRKHIDELNKIKNDSSTTDDDLKNYLARLKKRVQTVISEEGLDGINGTRVNLDPSIFKIKSKSDLKDNYSVDDLFTEFDTTSTRKDKLEKERDEFERILNDPNSSYSDRVSAYQNIEIINRLLNNRFAGGSARKLRKRNKNFYKKQASAKLLKEETIFDNGGTPAVAGEDGDEIVSILPASDSADAREGRAAFGDALADSLIERFSGIQSTFNKFNEQGIWGFLTDSYKESVLDGKDRLLNFFKDKFFTKSDNANSVKKDNDIGITPVVVLNNPNRKTITTLRRKFGGTYIQDQTVKNKILEDIKDSIAPNNLPLSSQIAESLVKNKIVDTKDNNFKGTRAQDGTATLQEKAQEAQIEISKQLKESLPPIAKTAKEKAELVKKSNEKSKGFFGSLIEGDLFGALGTLGGGIVGGLGSLLSGSLSALGTIATAVTSIALGVGKIALWGGAVYGTYKVVERFFGGDKDGKGNDVKNTVVDEMIGVGGDVAAATGHPLLSTAANATRAATALKEGDTQKAASYVPTMYLPWVKGGLPNYFLNSTFNKLGDYVQNKTGSAAAGNFTRGSSNVAGMGLALAVPKLAEAGATAMTYLPAGAIESKIGGKLFEKLAVTSHMTGESTKFFKLAKGAGVVTGLVDAGLRFKKGDDTGAFISLGGTAATAAASGVAAPLVLLGTLAAQYAHDKENEHLIARMEMVCNDQHFLSDENSKKETEAIYNDEKLNLIQKAEKIVQLYEGYSANLGLEMTGGPAIKAVEGRSAVGQYLHDVGGRFMTNFHIKDIGLATANLTSLVGWDLRSAIGDGTYVEKMTKQINEDKEFNDLYKNEIAELRQQANKHEDWNDNQKESWCNSIIRMLYIDYIQQKQKTELDKQFAEQAQKIYEDQDFILKYNKEIKDIESDLDSGKIDVENARKKLINIYYSDANFKGAYHDTMVLNKNAKDYYRDEVAKGDWYSDEDAKKIKSGDFRPILERLRSALDYDTDNLYKFDLESKDLIRLENKEELTDDEKKIVNDAIIKIRDSYKERIDNAIKLKEETLSKAEGDFKNDVFGNSNFIFGHYDNGIPDIIKKDDTRLITERFSGITNFGQLFEIAEKGPEIVSNGNIIPVGDNYQAKNTQAKLKRIQEDLYKNSIHNAEGMIGPTIEAAEELKKQEETSSWYTFIDDIKDDVKEIKEQQSSNVANVEEIKKQQLTAVQTDETIHKQDLKNVTTQINVQEEEKNLLDQINSWTKKGFDKASEYYKDVKKFIKDSGILETLANGFDKSVDYVKDLANTFFESDEFKSEQVNKADSELSALKEDSDEYKQFLADVGVSSLDEFKALDVDKKYEKLKKSKFYGDKINKELDKKWSDLTVSQDLTAESANIRAAKDVLSEEKGNIAKSITAEQLGPLENGKKFENLSDEEKIFLKFKQSNAYKNAKEKPKNYSEISTLDAVKYFGFEDKKNQKVQDMMDAAERNKEKYAASKRESSFEAAVKAKQEEYKKHGLKFSEEQLAGDFSDEGRMTTEARLEEAYLQAEQEWSDKKEMEEEERKAKKAEEEEMYKQLAIEEYIANGEEVPDYVLNSVPKNQRLWTLGDFENDDFKKDLAFAKLNGIDLKSYNKITTDEYGQSIDDNGKIHFGDKLNVIQSQNLKDLREQRLAYENENGSAKSSAEYEFLAAQKEYDDLETEVQNKITQNNDSYDKWYSDTIAKIQDAINRTNAEIEEHNKTFSLSQEPLITETPEEVFKHIDEPGYWMKFTGGSLMGVGNEKKDRRKYSGIDELLNTQTFGNFALTRDFGLGTISNLQEKYKNLNTKADIYRSDSKLSAPVFIGDYLKKTGYNNITEVVDDINLPENIKRDIIKQYWDNENTKAEKQFTIDQEAQLALEEELAHVDDKEEDEIGQVTPTQIAEQISEVVSENTSSNVNPLKDNELLDFATNYIKTEDDIDTIYDLKSYIAKKVYDLAQNGGQIHEAKALKNSLMKKFGDKVGLTDATDKEELEDIASTYAIIYYKEPEKIEPVVTKAQEVKKYSKSLDNLSHNDQMDADDALMWAEGNGRESATEFMPIAVRDWNLNQFKMGTGELGDRTGKWFSELSPEDKKKFNKQLGEYQDFGTKWKAEHLNDEDRPIDPQQAFINYEISQIKKNENYPQFSQKIEELLAKDPKLMEELDVYSSDDQRVKDFWESRQNLDTEMWSMFNANDPYKRRAIVQIIGQAIIDKNNKDKYKRWSKSNNNENQTQQIIDDIQKTKEQDIIQNQENLIDANRAKISNITSTNYQLDAEAGKLGTEQIVDGLKDNASQIVSSNNSAVYRIAKAGNTSSVVNNVTYNDADRYYRLAEGSPAQMRA